MAWKWGDFSAAIVEIWILEFWASTFGAIFREKAPCSITPPLSADIVCVNVTVPFSSPLDIVFLSFLCRIMNASNPMTARRIIPKTLELIINDLRRLGEDNKIPCFICSFLLYTDPRIINI
jgi:hypothetical protein